jgi:tetratricopeptide (TPR) repeat protein
MYRPRIVAALVAVLLVALCATTFAGGKSRRRDQRDQALGDANSAYESGKQYAQSGMYDQAIAQFETAITQFEQAAELDAELPKKHRVPMDPRHALAYMNMGVCNIQKGEDYRPRAREQLETASRLPEGAEDALIWYNVMAIRTLMGDHVAAIDALDKALDLGFKNFDALRTDEDLYELRRKPEWRATLEKHGVFL